jgi:hypothetical protein
MRNTRAAIVLSIVALSAVALSAKAQSCGLNGEWQLTDAGTKNNGRVTFIVKDSNIAATFKGTGPVPADQNHAWPLSRIYCDDEFITFRVQSWGDFWFFRKETDGSSVKWIGRCRRYDESSVSEAVFFPIAAPRR